MTACTNNGGKARRVVTAALVGVLSVGAVPAIALAQGGEISTLAIDWSTDAEITSATDGKGATAGTKDVTFELGSGKYLVPTAIDGVALDDSYTLTYFANEDGADTPDDGVLVGLKDGANYKGSGVSEFTYNLSTGLTAEQAAAYFSGSLTDSFGTKVVVKEDVYKVTVTKIGETGSVSANFRLAEESEETVITAKGNFYYDGANKAGDIHFYKEDGTDAGRPSSWKNAAGATINGTSEVIDAGTYYAVFTDCEVKVEILPVDLSTATLVIGDLASVPTAASLPRMIEINGTDMSAAVEVSSIVGASKLDFGPNTVTIAPKDGQEDSNIKGSATVSFTVYATKVADAVRYGRDDVTDGTVNLYLEDGDSFDASKIKVEGTLGGQSVSYSGDQLEVTYVKVNDDGTKTAVEASELSNLGTYEVTTRVEPFKDFATNKWCGGSVNFTVKVNATSLDANKTAGFYFDGELAGSGTAVLYDGTDQLDKLEVVVTNADGDAMVEGTDYDLKITKDDKAVEEAVDYGIYKVVIEPKTFEFSNSDKDDYTFTLNVKQVSVKLADQEDVAYTGSAITPVATYYVYDVDGNPVLDDDGKQVQAELPAEMYNVVTIRNGKDKVVPEIVDADTYEVTVALSDAAKSNYVLSDGTFELTVKEYGHFADVDPTQWYAAPIEKAYKLEYVNGVGGTNLYAPMATITRSEVACILYNMAAGYGISDNDFHFTEDSGYITGFSDVDGHSWYARAVAWADAMGVVNGYADGTFGVSRTITREEFACMLANYAKAMNKFEASDGSALAALPDADKVSDWAKEAVAWAVENGIMGNNGYASPSATITRAEVAAMAVNFQPEKLPTAEKLPSATH